jgi:hypothetical protein
MIISLERFSAKPIVSGGECYRMFVDNENMGFVIFPPQGSKYGIPHKRYLVNIEYSRGLGYTLTFNDDIHGRVHIMDTLCNVDDLQFPYNGASGVFIGCKDYYQFDNDSDKYEAMMKKVLNEIILNPDPIFLKFE